MYCFRGEIMGLGCMDVFSMGTDAVKGDSDMRITKEPEVRRQEILDTALRLFGEQGYEKTSITDIARAIGVAQGLCYRYFPSKETLFDSAVEQYADQLVESFTGIQISRDQTLRQMIETMPIVAEDRNSSYYSVFHGAKNKKFHDQLSIKVCEKLVSIVEKLLQKAQQKGEIQMKDLQTAAMFCVYGQLGILLADHLEKEEKVKRIREFLIFALHL